MFISFGARYAMLLYAIQFYTILNKPATQIYNIDKLSQSIDRVTAI